MFRCLGMAALGLSGRQSELIELALSNGFKGLDLDLLDFAATVKSSDLAKARRFIDSAKLKLGSFQLPFDWQGDEATYRVGLSQLPELAALAAELGCRRAETTVLPGSDERPLHQNFDFYRRRLLELAGVLEPLGVKLAVGFEPAIDRRTGFAFEFIYDFDTLSMLMGMAPSKALCFVIDSWNIVAGGGSLETIKRLPVDKLGVVYLADAVEELPAKQFPRSNRVLPGETGLIDNQGLLTWLAEIGYDGPVYPAPEPATLAGQRREAIVKAAGEKLDALWKAAGLNAAGKLAPAATKP